MYYFERIDLEDYLRSIYPIDLTVIDQVKYFTRVEAERRNSIVLGYFGVEGVNSIVDQIVGKLKPILKPRCSVIDVGAGTGFFTGRVAEKILREISGLKFYALDTTPAMLKVLAENLPNIVPILGVVENIVGSVEAALKYVDAPKQFNALYSVLMLHHCVDISRVFQSVFEALNDDGRAVIIDLCRHPFKEFREEMGDVHLGFDIEEIGKLASKLFKVHIGKIHGIKCTSTGRSAELFVAVLDR